MKTLIEMLLHTPLYVYGVFAYLLIVGLSATKKRTVSFYKNIFFILLFSYLIGNNLTKLDLLPSHYALGLLILMSSGLLSYKQMANADVLVNRKKMLISLPGSWNTLCLVLLIFWAKYYLGYQSACNPSFLWSFEAKLITICVSGFSLGNLLGRSMNLLVRLLSPKQTEEL